MTDPESPDGGRHGLGPENAGLECRHCGCRHFYTLRTVRLRRSIQRRRQCRHCGRRVTTRETILGTDE